MRKPTKDFVCYLVALTAVFLLVFLLGAFSGHSASADVPTVPDVPHQAPAEYCNGMAQLAEAIAESRDRGVAYEQLALLMSFLENPYHQRDAGHVVEFVYSFPNTPADRLASLIFEGCFNFYTTEV